MATPQHSGIDIKFEFDWQNKFMLRGMRRQVYNKKKYKDFS